MSTENRVFSKLFKETAKSNFKKHSKINLNLGQNLQAEIDKVNSIYEQTNTEIDNSFVPIRQIEKLMSEVNSDISINEYVDALQNLEELYNIETDKLRQAENDLGITIPRPEILDEAVRQIEKLQDSEEQLRNDLNEYNGYLKMLFS
jgi:uncharacterized protein (DUF885 family)